MVRMKLVLVGNGMAGMRTLEELLRAAPDLVRAASLKAGRTAADALGDYINPWSPKP